MKSQSKSANESLCRERWVQSTARFVEQQEAIVTGDRQILEKAPQSMFPEDVLTVIRRSSEFRPGPKKRRVMKSQSKSANNSLQIARQCLLCSAKKRKGGPRLLTITPLVYGGVTRLLKLGRGVFICEDCFAKAVWGDWKNSDTRNLCLALMERVRATYNALQEASA